MNNKIIKYKEKLITQLNAHIISYMMYKGNKTMKIHCQVSLSQLKKYFDYKFKEKKTTIHDQHKSYLLKSIKSQSYFFKNIKTDKQGETWIELNPKNTNVYWRISRIMIENDFKMSDCIILQTLYDCSIKYKTDIHPRHLIKELQFMGYVTIYETIKRLHKRGFIDKIKNKNLIDIYTLKLTVNGIRKGGEIGVSNIKENYKILYSRETMRKKAKFHDN